MYHVIVNFILFICYHVQYFSQLWVYLYWMIISLHEHSFLLICIPDDSSLCVRHFQHYVASQSLIVSDYILGGSFLLLITLIPFSLNFLKKTQVGSLELVNVHWQHMSLWNSSKCPMFSKAQVENRIYFQLFEF